MRWLPVAFLTIVSALLFARLTSILSQILSSTHCPPHSAFTWQSPVPGWRQPPWVIFYLKYLKCQMALHQNGDIMIKCISSVIAYLLYHMLQPVVKERLVARASI